MASVKYMIKNIININWFKYAFKFEITSILYHFTRQFHQLMLLVQNEVHFLA